MEISVIIPVYNKSAYISECLDSLLQQDFDDFEIITVDDGSTDDSGTCCDLKAADDSRIRVVHTPNGGVTAARRRGVEEADGKYIVFVDADDQLLPGALTTLHQAIVKHEADEVIATFCTQDGVRSPVVYEGLVEDVTPLIQAVITGRNRFPILWAVIFRKELISGCLDTTREIIEGEDLLMQLKVLMKNPRVWFISDCVYRYSLGLPNSRSHTLQRAMKYDEVLREVLQPRWPEMKPQYTLHQVKEYERFMLEGQDNVKELYYRHVLSSFPDGVPLFHRFVWHLPPSAGRLLVALYNKVVKLKQHGL